MILIKNSVEIQKMREGGLILVRILKKLATQVKPGVTTADLEFRARDLTQSLGVKPAFLNYQGYPATLCVSLNDEIVHGIPSKKRTIQSGDLVSLDCGVSYQGLITDAALTIGVGRISLAQRKLLRVTRLALKRAITKACSGNRVSDISAAIQETIEKAGFNVIRDCVGHGVGHKVHEDPIVPNFVTFENTETLKPGMTIAIEPIATLGDFRTKTGSDGWVVKTRDQSTTAHFEQTIVVGVKQAEILTPF